MQAAASRHTAPCRGRRQDRLLQRGDIDTPKTWTCGCVVAAAMEGGGSECAHGCAPERSRHARTSTAPSEADHCTGFSFLGPAAAHGSLRSRPLPGFGFLVPAVHGCPPEPTPAVAPQVVIATGPVRGRAIPLPGPLPERAV